MERAGFTVRMVEGRADNIKVTRPEDLSLAGLYLQQQNARQPAQPASPGEPAYHPRFTREQLYADDFLEKARFTIAVKIKQVPHCYYLLTHLN